MPSTPTTRSQLLAPWRGRTTLLRIAHNGAWLFGEQFLRASLGAVVGIIVARYLGPTSFGTLAVVFAYLMIFSSASGLGLQSVVVRDLVREPASRPAILGSALLLRMASALIALAAGIGLVRLIEGSPGPLVVMMAIAACALPFQCSEIVDFLFQSELRGRESSIARGAAFLAASVARLSLVILGAPLIYFAATPVLDAIVTAALLTLFLTKRSDTIGRWRFDPTWIRRLLRDSLPVAISGFFVIGLMQIDRLLLETFKGSEAVGIYSAASLLSGAWYAIPAIVGSSVAPALTALHSGHPAAYTRKLADVFGAVMALALLVGLICSLLSSPIISLLFGPEFHPAARVLTIHVWTGVFVAHVSIRTRALMIEGGERTVLLLSVLTLVANILLNLWFIPAYAEIGAAWASLLSWALGSLLFPLLVPRSRHFVTLMLRSALPTTWLRGIRRSPESY